ncbi:MAG: hypothetical protein GY855_15780 [candidate division Zixibacteria bacterium]|nr:hypothetical protein [candidate division Zixibacteria bacterium]
MYNQRKRRKPSQYIPPRGIKLHRKKKFEPVLETKSGIKVRSKYEVTTANYLYNNSIEFLYEPLMILGGQQYRPDFYLPEYNLFLEICGYNHMPYYRDRSAYKYETYKRHGLQFIFIYYNGKGSLEKIIKEELEKFSVVFSETQE